MSKTRQYIIIWLFIQEEETILSFYLIKNISIIFININFFVPKIIHKKKKLENKYKKKINQEK